MHALRLLSLLCLVTALLPWGAYVAPRFAAAPALSLARQADDPAASARQTADSAALAPKPAKTCRTAILGSACNPVYGVLSPLPPCRVPPPQTVQRIAAQTRSPAPIPREIFHPPRFV